MNAITSVANVLSKYSNGVVHGQLPELGKVKHYVSMDFKTPSQSTVKMKINQIITIKLVGFNKQEIEHFSAILDLAEGGLQHSWRIVDSAPADFYLLAEAGQNEVHTLLFPRERCLFYSIAKETDDDHLLLIDSRGLPRLRSVIEVFNRIALKINNNVDNNNETDVLQTLPVSGDNNMNNTSVFIPEGLLKNLLDSLITPITMEYPLAHRLTNLPNCSVIYTHASENVYYCSANLEELDAYINNDNTLLSRTISKAKLLNDVEGMQARPLKNLLWYLAFKSSQGRLLQGHTPKQIVCLNNWPDLSIATCRSYMKLIAFMRHNTVEIHDIATNTQICVQDVYNFYNACYLIGLVDIKEHIELQCKEHHQRDLLNKINHRLKDLTIDTNHLP